MSSQVSLLSEVSTTPSISQHSSTTGFSRKFHITHKHHKLNLHDMKISSNPTSLYESNIDIPGAPLSLFKLIKECTVYNVEVINNGQGKTY